MPPAPDPSAPLPRERRQATDAEARALASSLRLRIIRMCIDEPLTNREIAEALGKNPATVLHHVRTLVDTGFLTALEPRRGNRGAREIPYRSTDKSWYTQAPNIAPTLIQAFLDEIETLPNDDVEMTRLGLRLPADELQEFRDRFHALCVEFKDRRRDPDAPAWSVFLALHPDTSQRQR